MANMELVTTSELFKGLFEKAKAALVGCAGLATAVPVKKDDGTEENTFPEWEKFLNVLRNGTFKYEYDVSDSGERNGLPKSTLTVTGRWAELSADTLTEILRYGMNRKTADATKTVVTRAERFVAIVNGTVTTKKGGSSEPEWVAVARDMIKKEVMSQAVTTKVMVDGKLTDVLVVNAKGHIVASTRFEEIVAKNLAAYEEDAKKVIELKGTKKELSI